MKFTCQPSVFLHIYDKILVGIRIQSFYNFATMCTFNIDESRKMFASLDQNGDGQVSIDELKWLLEMTGVNTSTAELELLVGKKALDLVEFSRLHDSLLSNGCSEEDEEEEESCLFEAFKVFDLNGDGFLSPEEITHVLVKLGMWSDNGRMDCNMIVRAYDVNSDGFVDFHEFKKMMLAVVQ